MGAECNFCKLPGVTEKGPRRGIFVISILAKLGKRAVTRIQKQFESAHAWRKITTICHFSLSVWAISFCTFFLCVLFQRGQCHPIPINSASLQMSLNPANCFHKEPCFQSKLAIFPDCQNSVNFPFWKRLDEREKKWVIGLIKSSFPSGIYRFLPLQLNSRWGRKRGKCRSAHESFREQIVLEWSILKKACDLNTIGRGEKKQNKHSRFNGQTKMAIQSFIAAHLRLPSIKGKETLAIRRNSRSQTAKANTSYLSLFPFPASIPAFVSTTLIHMGLSIMNLV